MNQRASLPHQNPINNTELDVWLKWQRDPEFKCKLQCHQKKKYIYGYDPF
jgi:hypothetical protein